MIFGIYLHEFRFYWIKHNIAHESFSFYLLILNWWTFIRGTENKKKIIHGIVSSFSFHFDNETILLCTSMRCFLQIKSYFMDIILAFRYLHIAYGDLEIVCFCFGCWPFVRKPKLNKIKNENRSAFGLLCQYFLLTNCFFFTHSILRL